MFRRIEEVIKKILAYALPLVAIIMLGFTIFSISYKKIQPPREITNEPPKSIFKNQIAGIGIVEPRTKSHKLMPYTKGIVSKIYVEEDEEITKNQQLFTTDDREILAELLYAQAKTDTARIHFEDLEYNYNLYKDLGKSGTVSDEEISKKRFAMLKAKAQYHESLAEYNILKTRLERLAVHSPISGRVLQLNIRVGEYADTDSSFPPIIVGDMRNMKVDVTIDETDIARFNKFAKAYGIIRGSDNKRIPLQFSLIQPNIVPKKNITNDPAEKIDMRVMKIVYHFDNKDVGAYPGQQMDVFIEDKQ